MKQKQAMLTVKISEIFESIQGEGPNAGRPALFIRLSGCNLKCNFCDTKYAVEGKYMTYEEVEKRIKESHLTFCVITGGEPLLFPLFVEWISEQFPDIEFEIETNGTKMPVSFNYNTSYIVSPKLSNSGQQISYNEGILGMFKTHQDNFKFVVSNEADVHEVMTFLSEYHLLGYKRIWLMPEGRTFNKKKWIEVVQFVKIYGFKFSPRLQILLYGNKRAI